MNTTEKSSALVAGDLKVNPELLEASWRGVSLGLGRREVRVLARLMRAHGHPVSVTGLLDEFWREARDPAPELVFASMSRLRRRLRAVGLAGRLRTIPTVGYIFRM